MPNAVTPAEAKPAVQDTTPKADAQAQAAKTPAPAPDTLTVPAATPEPAKAEATKGAESTEAKPEEGAKPKDGEKPAAPETLELKLPEDSLLDVEFAKGLGLDQKRAEKLAERMKADHADWVEAQKEALHKKSSVDWVAEVKADKEIGGDKFLESVETAKRFVARFGSDALKKALNETGLGNHPELVRIFSKAGRSMQDDKLVVPNAQAASKEKAIEEVMFPMEELRAKETA